MATRRAQSPAPAAAQAHGPPGTAATTARAAPRRPRADLAARLVRATALRAAPRGRTVARLGTRTPFGSPRILAVVARRPGWLAVLSEELPNGRAGWVRARDARLLAVRWRLEVDLSARRMLVRRDGEVRRRVPVGIGGGATPTPPGRYAVTDLLAFEDPGSPYGCCALALSGRQPDVPQGWPGGDRLAVHGTRDETSVGQARSLGCLRARETDLRWSLRRVPAGTRVTIVP